MSIQMRLETSDDYFEIENLTREAFWSEERFALNLRGFDGLFVAMTSAIW